ncbi:hypothetical protein [Streptomyces parvus]|uniref:hypothetical protein n=1 Tax=Streptomyces TaxID=1883 RepID=UPI00081B84BB|nr:hypothetical protein GA0115253_106319 [Streptomyces sp. Termitarium-T10T-6]
MLLSRTVFRRYERDLTYTTAEYLDVLRIHSGHRALLEAARSGLLACVAGLIGQAVRERKLWPSSGPSPW